MSRLADNLANPQVRPLLIEAIERLAERSAEALTQLDHLRRQVRQAHRAFEAAAQSVSREDDDELTAQHARAGIAALDDHLIDRIGLLLKRDD